MMLSWHNVEKCPGELNGGNVNVRWYVWGILVSMCSGYDM